MLIADFTGLGKEIQNRSAFVGHGEGTLAGAVENLIQGQAHRVGNRGIEVGNLDGVLDNVFTAFVGFTVFNSAFEANLDFTSQILVSIMFRLIRACCVDVNIIGLLFG